MPRGKTYNLGTPLEVIEAVKKLSGKDQLNLYDLIASWQLDRMRQTLRRRRLPKHFNRDHITYWGARLKAQHFTSKDALFFSLKVSGRL